MLKMSGPTSDDDDNNQAPAVSKPETTPPPPSKTQPRPPPSNLATWASKLPPSSLNSFCGAAAGVASGIVTCPLDVIKTKLQAQGSFRSQQLSRNQPNTTVVYRGLVGTARTIIKQDGLKGMYRGLGPMLLGYLPTWAVYMSVYDSSKGYYVERVSKLPSALNLLLFPPDNHKILHGLPTSLPPLPPEPHRLLSPTQSGSSKPV